MRKLDLIGKKFGRWNVISFAGCRIIKGDSRRFWNCVCECGKEKIILANSLLRQNSKSCGCLKRDKKKTHGMSKTKEYRTWWDMIQRCRNTNSERYTRYGGRGIFVCKRWHKFINFYNDMGKKPSKDYSVDRINNNKGYSPSNCRWATRSEQQKNKG